MKSEKKCQLKKRKKNESTRLTCQTCNPGHEMGKTKKKSNPMLKDMRSR